MASFLDELLKKMKTAPHVGIPPVTNPKVPTKAERDAAEYAARELAKPKVDYGSGSSFDQLMQHIANSPHPEMRFGDPAFSGNALCNVWDDSLFDMDRFEYAYQNFKVKMGKGNKK